MRPAARGCAPFLSPARHHLWSRGVRTPSFSSRVGSTTVLNGGRPIHLLAQRAGCGNASPLGSSWSSRIVRLEQCTPAAPLLGTIQTRSLKKANYVENIGDNERSEELLQSLEVRDGEKDTQPQRQAVDKKGEDSSAKGKEDSWSDFMTKGTGCFISQGYLLIGK